MIRTNMTHKTGRSPGTMLRNIPGHPSSKNVIKTSVSKKSCCTDKFVYRKGGCIYFQGGPTTEYLD